MTDENKTQQEIEEIRQLLSSMEDTDFHYMDEELRDLRHRVIYVHTVIEEYMGVRIGQILLRNPSGTQIVEADRHVFAGRLAYVLNEMEFAKKVKVIEKFKTFPSDLISEFWKVNSIRVYFSHPSTYLKEIKEFNERTKYLSTLKLLKKTLDDLNDLIRKEEKPQ